MSTTTERDSTLQRSAFLLYTPSVIFLALLVTLAAQESRPYVGSQACAACHPAIAKAQEASDHARSMRPLAEVPELSSHLPFRSVDAASGAEVVFLRNSVGEFELIARREQAEQRATLFWAFGGGSKGITPVGRLSTGEFLEGQLSWFRSTSNFDMTPGAEDRHPAELKGFLGKILSDQDRTACFGCHTSNLGAGEIPARNQMGIHCERCHGPGREHMRAMQHPPVSDKKILHPGKLTAVAQVQLCGACHGRPPDEADFAAIRFIKQTPATARFPSQRLVLSRCFLASDAGIKCTACHNPHVNVAQPESYDRVCLRCHPPQKRTGATACRVAKEKGASCHMPEQQVLRRLSFTDHWIRIIRSSG